MIHKFFWCCFILSLSVACNNAAKQNASQDTLQPADTVTGASPDRKSEIDTSKPANSFLTESDTLLTVDLKNNKGSVKAYLNGMGKHVTLIIPVKGGDSLTAELVAADTANIRFNQIYIPVGKSGKFDGPFGRKISYPVTITGNYRLIIGENLMAEGDWKGNFSCNVVIK